MMNACAFLTKSAVRFPDRPAVRFGARTLTYAELATRALSLGGELLAKGLRKGDRVAFALQNGPEVLETIFGCFAAGLVVVPMNARLHPREMAYIVQNSGARAFIHGPDFEAGVDAEIDAFAGLEHRFGIAPAGDIENYADLVASGNALPGPVEVDSEDPSWLFYTSGTTGRPKGATWTHRTVRIVVMNYLADVYNIQPDDVVLHAAPLSHGSGIVALPAIARAATNVIVDSPSFSPDVLFGHVERLKVSHIAFLAPTQIVRCLEEFVPGRFDLSSLKAICYGGAPIYVDQLHRAVEAFGPVFVQIYGQGECPITATALPISDHARFLATADPRLGSAGFPRTDVEVRVVDAEGRPQPAGEAGEIVVRGDVVMAGYWNDDAATAAALRGGWLHTGDIGMFDGNGYLYLLDRTKDVIITGGNNVYPREVEEVIITHPDVANVAVVGIPDDYWGEAVHAVVVPQPGSALTDRALIDFCAQSLAGYKKPKAVDFVDELPLSAYGKVLRREVRARYWAGYERQVAGGNVVAR
jgi:acyl-CoA synthetase (AMP-forming)/AMP-acid ligase II